MSFELESWETRKEAERAAGHSTVSPLHPTASPLGGEAAAGRRETEEHRLSNKLAEQARGALVESTMAALRQCTSDTERKGYIKTLQGLHLTSTERAHLMEVLRKQGAEQLLQEGEKRDVGTRGQVYIAIRKYSILRGRMEELLQRVQDGFVPIISQQPGFIAYHALPVGNDQVVTISIFSTPTGAVESISRALEWVREQVADLIQGTPEAMAGQVRASSESAWIP